MAFGDIGAIIDSRTWHGADVYFPFISHVREDIYIIAEGWSFVLRTIRIDEDGNISAVLDNVTVEAGGTTSAKEILHVDGDIYAVAYAGAAGNVVRTFTVDVDGNIGAVIDSEILANIPPNLGYYPFLMHAHGDIYVVAYTDDDSDGWIKTLRINNDGSIDPFLDSWEVEPDRGRYPWLAYIGNQMCALAMSSTASNRGELHTFSVDAAGNIATFSAWSFELNADAYQGAGGLVLISSVDHTYAIVYQGAASVGEMVTCTITPDGRINGNLPLGGPAIDTWTYDPGPVYPRYALNFSSNLAGDGRIFCIGQGYNSQRQVWTVEILNDGTIIKSLIDSLTLVSTDWALEVSLVRVSGPDEIIVAACYESLVGANSGELDTFPLEGRVTPLVETLVATEVS